MPLSAQRTREFLLLTEYEWLRATAAGEVTPEPHLKDEKLAKWEEHQEEEMRHRYVRVFEKLECLSSNCKGVGMAGSYLKSSLGLL